VRANIWPAGSIPIQWEDGERIEWLNTDYPVIGIELDHSVTSLRIEIPYQDNEVDQCEIQGPETVTFARLPIRENAEYKVLIEVNFGARREEIGNFIVSFTDVENATLPSSPIQVYTRAENSSLEEALNGTFECDIFGSAGNFLKVSLSRLDRYGNAIETVEAG